ncbi:VOC family protein [Lysinibacillus piscis]|uniref:Glyoxalase-like domain-containing protein n=1 Tax=Lysinibacillus piscis TaxID=2518931 RepID=A0ABQ5NES4_9BACI|nr:VOC family protein [Lysinibacillus sp. KH24]GLC86895.1 hypothetical protein LYSBPC_00220 [Lysinibacillus sp. KH24]
MALHFDHLVHQVQSPENAKVFFNKRSIHTVDGGTHTMWGTYNTLSYFGLSYIEHIAVYDETLFEQAATLPYSLHATFQQQNHRFGFSRVALRTNRIEQEGERLRALGFDVYGPDMYSRTRPDGTVIQWKLLHFGIKGQTMDFPFLIEWADGDEQRLAQLQQSGAIDSKQQITMEAVQFFVKDVQATVTQWQKLLQLPQAEQHPTHSSLHLPNIRFDFYEKAEAQSWAFAPLAEGPFGVLLQDMKRVKETLILPGAVCRVNTPTKNAK